MCVHAKYRCQFFSNLEVSVAGCFGSGGGRARSPRHSAASDRRPMHCARNRTGCLTERASTRSARRKARPTLNRREPRWSRRRGAFVLRRSGSRRSSRRSARAPVTFSRQMFRLLQPQHSYWAGLFLSPSVGAHVLSSPRLNARISGLQTNLRRTPVPCGSPKLPQEPRQAVTLIQHPDSSTSWKVPSCWKWMANRPEHSQWARGSSNRRAKYTTFEMRALPHQRRPSASR